MKYLIIVEIERTGFITEFKSSFKEAFDFSNKLYLSLSELFPIDKREKIVDVLKERGYASYKINGTELYFGKCKDQITDGILTVSVVEIDSNKFNLQMLIKERENSSLVFNYDEPTGKIDEIADKFPHLSIVAN